MRRQSKRSSPDDVATRKRVEDFNEFAPLFENIQKDLKQNIRKRIAFGKDVGTSNAKIQQGQFFILSGLIAYIAAIGEPIKAPNSDNDSRLRVIFSNGMESDMLLRSLQRALYKDEGGMRISEPEIRPLFSGEVEDDDLASGTIYVLRSNSPHPEISKHRDFIHKIGVTGGKIQNRIAMAKNDPTFLMDEVEIVATYEVVI